MLGQACMNANTLALLSRSWQSATPTKRLWSTSKKRRIRSRSTARILLNPRTSSASSARPKSGYASQSASNRSSRPEKFVSLFFARFTFFSVSVTRYAALPIGLRPAPFLFPPLVGVFILKKYISFRLTISDSIYIISNSQTSFMANKRLSKEKQTLVLMALCEGIPIRAAARMFKVGKNAIHRLICETGEAFADYIDANFRDLPMQSY